jgi:molybdopterin/thiamine biosynthesis adenylyltransferase
MDLSKSREFFDPAKINGKVHIIGCGSVGSVLAENLARCGVTDMVLYDFDKVEPKNIANQMFFQRHIGMPKVDALKEILCEINPDCENVQTKPEGWNGKLLSGYVFLCPDSIEVRKDFVKKHFNSPMVKAVFDFRTELESAQHYAADWNNPQMKEDLFKSMDCTPEEADADTPVSACGVTLGVATTVRLICAYGVNNFINFVKTGEIKKLVLMDGFHFTLDAF